MKWSDIKNKHEGFSDHGTGGNCTAWGGDMSTLQTEILVTDGNNSAPDDNTEEFHIAVFITDHGEPDHIFTTTNADHADELISACLSLWGN